MSRKELLLPIGCDRDRDEKKDRKHDKKEMSAPSCSGVRYILLSTDAEPPPSVTSRSATFFSRRIVDMKERSVQPRPKNSSDGSIFSPR